MFQLKKIHDLFNCKRCKDVLVDPVILPCGETVCKTHTNEINQGKCILCFKTHSVPKEGFIENRTVKNLLEYKAQKINLNFSQFNDYNKIIQDLNKNLREIEAIRKDPDNYISEYFGELTRQVDLRRETLIEDIHKYSDELIQKIEKLKLDCVAKSKEASKITDELDMIKTKINGLNSTFDSLEVDDIRIEEINDLVEPALKRYKFELQGKKYYKLSKKETKLKDVFVSLSCFYHDIDKKMVNIVCYFQM